MGKDLRSFLQQMEELLPRQIARVKKEVASKFEVCGLLRNLELKGRAPILICENALDVEGRPSAYPLISNLFASRENIALALGLPSSESGLPLTLKASELAKTPIAPTLVDTRSAPVKEKIFRGNDVDLTRFPIPVHHELDGGPYILASSLVQVDPGFGTYNTSMVRFHLKGPRRVCVNMIPGHHNGFIYRKYQERGEPMPVAIVVGHHPGFYMGSQWESAGSQGGVSEYDLIGAMLQEPMEAVPSESFGKDLLVPARAELVIEGLIPPDEKEDEGPISEHTRYYKHVRGGQHISRSTSVMNVTAVTCRRDAYYLDTFIGHADQNLIGSIPKEGAILNQIKGAAPGVKAVHLPLSGCGRYICYISLKQRVAGEARNAILAAFGVDWHLKYVIAVDDDIDVYSEPEVLWALSLRSQPADDTFVIPKAAGARLDPTTPMEDDQPLSSKMGIDATRPFGKPFSAVGEVPKAVLAKMKPEDYL